MSTGDKGKAKSRPQSEDRFRLLFDGTADALYLHDLEGRFVEVNQAACDSLGYSRKELLQLPFSTIVKGDKPEGRCDVWARVSKGEKLTVRGHHRRRDGTLFPVEVHLGPFEYAGRPHILASARDITERLEAEETIRQNSEKYRRLQANIPGMVYLYALHPDGSYSFPFANAASRELFDIAPEDLMRDGTLLAELIHPDDRERRDKAIRHSAATLQPFREELRHIVKGEVRWYDIMSRPEPQPNGNILWDGIMLEITDRKRAEAALAESEQRFSTFMAHLPAAVFIKDQEGRLLFANRYLRDLFGWEDCLGKTTEELVPPELAASMAADDRQVLSAGPLVIQERITNIHGVEHDFDTYKFPIISEGAPILMGGIAVDVSERKRAVEALELSENKYRSFYQGMLEGFVSVHMDGSIVETNQSYLEMIGYTAPEVQGLRYQDITPAKWHKFEADIIQQQVLTRGYSDTYEKEYIRKDGTVFPIELRAYLIQDKAGAAADMWAFVRDITARKRAEEALRDSERRLLEIIDFLPDATFAIDLSGKVITWNRAIEEMTGVLAESIIGKGNYEYALPFYGVRRPILIDLVLMSDAEMEKKYFFVKRQGDILLAEAEVPVRGEMRLLWGKARPLFDIEGNIVGAIEAIRDITEHKDAEKALRESEARFRQVVEYSPLPIAIAVEGGMIEYVNPKFVETFGYTLEDVPLLKDWYRRAYPDPAYRRKKIAHWQKALEKAAREGRPPEIIEVEVACKDGSQKIIDIFGTLVGKKTLGVFNDVTGRKRAQEERARLEAQMREVQKLESLGVLAGGIAHDFNNLLMAVLGNADLALLALSPASPARPNVEEIVRASQRAADLCRQMLAYSGKGRFVIGRYDLSEIVREMAQILKVSVSKKASLRYSFAAGLPPVEVDATQMRQVIMNLITNASEALGDASGVISVSTGVMDCHRAFLAESHLDDKLPEGRYVYLEVADSGGGMDEETRRRLFDPFFTTKFTGRGLGLAAVLGIVRGHRGAIKVRSEPGKGTAFTILLPAVAWQLGDRAQMAAPAAASRQQGTILLIDDDPHVRRVAGEMLARLGLGVLAAAHGQEGLEIFRERGEEIDCVLLDLTMPGMGGEEAFLEMRRLRPGVRVVLSSGYDEQDATQQFAGRGLAGFIQKPYTVAKLQEVLNRVLGP